MGMFGLAWRLPEGRDRRLEYSMKKELGLPESFWDFIEAEDEYLGSWKGYGLTYNPYLPYSDLSQTYESYLESPSLFIALLDGKSGVWWDSTLGEWRCGTMSYPGLSEVIEDRLGMAYRESLPEGTYITKEQWNHGKRYILAYRRHLLSWLRRRKDESEN